MDLQDNLLLTTINFGVEKKTFYNISSNLSKNIIFSFFEHEDAYLTNNAEDYDVYVENIEEGGENKISYTDKLLLNSGDHPYPPMEYRIRIVNKKTNISQRFLYKILHLSATNDSQYKTMISSIINYDENLLYDDDVKFLYSKRKINSSYKNLYASISYILDNKNIIINSLINISKNPYFKEKREVVKSDSIKKQSSRSIIKNIKSVKQDTMYSTKIIQITNCELNRYLIHILHFSLHNLNEIVNKLNYELEKNKNKINRIIEKSNPNEQLRKAHTKYQINMLNKRNDKVIKFIDFSKLLINHINVLLKMDSFKRITPSSARDKSIAYHQSYLNLEKYLFLPLFQGQSFSYFSCYNSILSLPIKSTSKLFEAYCLFSLEKAIEELGFVNDEDIIDYDHIIKNFYYNEFKIELMYEIEAKDVAFVKEGEVYYINSSTRHLLPDFYLILKRNEIPICFLVFDAKCRKSASVYNDINGRYQNTIRDYLSLRYSIDPNPFLMPKIVDSLWIFMPEDDKNDIYSKINNLQFEFVKLKMDGEENDFINLLNDYLILFL